MIWQINKFVFLILNKWTQCFDMKNMDILFWSTVYITEEIIAVLAVVCTTEDSIAVLTVVSITEASVLLLTVVYIISR
jgi:hypothetical protein